MKNNPTIKCLLTGLAGCLLAGAASAQTILYSENFDGEGTAINSYNATEGATTPEVNFGSIGAIQSTGASQGGTATDDAWLTRDQLAGQRGLRFGSNDNWATNTLNSAAILADGGFSIAFDFDLVDTANASDWMGVRVGNGGENAGINDAGVDLGTLIRGDGRITTFENGASDAFGTASAAAPRSVELRYAFDSWAAGTTVTFTGIVDGSTIASDTFTWDGTNDVKIVFAGATGTSGTTFDNLVISTIPEPSSFALLAGVLGLSWVMIRRRQ